MTGLPLNIDLQQILLHMLNFSILAVGLYLLLYKPVKDFMDKRENYYASLDDKARETLRQADADKALYEEKLKAVDAEILEKKQAADLENAKSREKQLENARKEAQQILENAKKQAVYEKDRMITEAKGEIAELAKEAAVKAAYESVSGAYDSFLDAAERGLDNE